jgi:HSP20 family protein
MNMMSMRELMPWSRSGSRSPAMFRGDTLSPFAALQQEVNRLFDETMGSFGMPTVGIGFGAGWPYAEMSETDKEFRVSFEIPGVNEKDVEVLLEGNELIIRGEKRSETEDKERRFTERFYGRFERRIPLGQDMEADGIRAECRDGVLTVTVPKSAGTEQKAKRIPVSAG